MLKRFIQFQLILSYSCTYRSQNGTVNVSRPAALTFLVIIGWALLSTPIFGAGGGVFLFVLNAMFSVYRIINCNNKIYELLPVSKNYIIVNIFLFSVLCCLLSFMAVLVFGYAFLLPVYMLILFLSGKNDVISSLVAIFRFSANADETLFLLLVILIALFVFTALSFIKSGKLRLAAIACFGIISYLLLLALKRSFPAHTGDSDYFFTGFNAMPQVHIIVWCTAAACLVLIPLSIFAARHFYLSRFALQVK